MNYKYSVVSPTWIAKQTIQDSLLNLCVSFAFRYESKWIFANDATWVLENVSPRGVHECDSCESVISFSRFWKFFFCSCCVQSSMCVIARQAWYQFVTVDVYFKPDLLRVVGFSNDRDPPIQNNIKYALC